MGSIALTDSHCHLDRLKLAECGGSIDAVLSSAAEAGVSRVLCISVDTDNIDKVVEVAGQHEQVFATAGVHPMSAHSHPISADALTHWAMQDKVVGIGETGLDYYYDDSHKQAQQASFAMHLEVAAQQKLPVVVHTREARADTLSLMREHGSPDSAGVLHCFTESWDMARDALDFGYYISISGIVTFHSADALRDVVKKLPADRMLVETDAPWLAPVPYRGKTNQPAYTRQVAEFVADLRGVTLEELALQTNENFERLFNRVLPGDV